MLRISQDEETNAAQIAFEQASAKALVLCEELASAAIRYRSFPDRKMLRETVMETTRRAAALKETVAAYWNLK